MAIAISDVGVQLFKKVGAETTFTKLLDVTAAPATGAAPQRLEATVLSSVKEQHIKGRSTSPEMEWDYNYTAANFALAVAAVTGEAEDFLIIYGDGSGVQITGEADTWVEPVGRNSVVVGKFYVAPEEIVHKTAAEVTALIA